MSRFRRARMGSGGKTKVVRHIGFSRRLFQPIDSGVYYRFEPDGAFAEKTGAFRFQLRY